MRTSLLAAALLVTATATLSAQRPVRPDAPATPASQPGVSVTATASCTRDEQHADRTHCNSERKEFGNDFSGFITLMATCPTGYRVVSGGHRAHMRSRAQLADSYPSSQGWWVVVTASTSIAPLETSHVQAKALCERHSR